MSYHRFQKMGRVLHGDIYTIKNMMNEKRLETWTLFEKINLDDDQEPWKGRGGPKQKNDRKAHGTGIVQYKGVDEKMFCFGAIHPYNPIIANQEGLQGTALVKWFNNRLPDNMSYLICADAGNMGSVAHARYLAEQGRRTLMSFVPNCDDSGKQHLLSKILDAGLEKHKWKILWVQKWQYKPGWQSLVANLQRLYILYQI